MVFLNFYIFLYSGFASFWSQVLGFGGWVSDNSANITLALGAAYLPVLLLKRKIKITPITFWIGGYVILRAVILISFALYNDYSLFAYILPIKNWVALFFFFIIGQSVDWSANKLHTVLFVYFAVFVGCAIAYELVAPFIEAETGFYESRLPFLLYRIPVDIFLTCYICMVSTMGFFSKEVSTRRYLLTIALISAAIVVSQIQQMLGGVILISIVISLSFFKHRLSNRYAIYFLSLAVLVAVAGISLYQYYTSAIQDIYFSIYRRNLLWDYVADKVIHYPLTGYPIPSPSFSENIPEDMWRNFFQFNFEETIYPSDIPLLSLLAEEGILGLLFVILFLSFCYKRNPDTKYFIYALLATLTNFRMYYLTTLIASFTYFMLGYLTSSQGNVYKSRKL